MAKKTLLNCINNLRKIQIKREFLICSKSKLYRNKVTVLQLKKWKQLYLVPHADDDLLGGYALQAFQGNNLIYGYYGFTGSNHLSENKAKRDNEFLKYVHYTGSSHFRIQNSEDIRNILIQNEIKTIYLPSIIDWHPEHRKLNYDLYDCIVKCLCLNNISDIEIIWYSVSVPIGSRAYDIVPMTIDEQNEKYKVFESIYLSQDHIFTDRFKLQEQINALGTDYFSGESFMKIDLQLWLNIIEKKRKEELNGTIEFLNNLKKDINSITKIRKKSSEFYNNI